MRPLYILAISCCLLSCQEMPVSSAEWVRLGPGGGGSTFLPTFSYHDPAHFAVKCDMTGAYFSGDAGQSYQMVNFPGGVGGFAYDPLDSNIIYCGAAALHKSEDGGKNWKTIFPVSEEILDSVYLGDHADFSYKTSPGSLYPGKPDEGTRLANLAVDFENNQQISFSIGSGLYYSQDAGQNWKQQDFLEMISAIFPTDAGLLVLTSTQGALFDPATQQVDSFPLPKAMQPAFSFAFGQLDSGLKSVLYALHHAGQEGEFGLSEVWKSTDMGAAWEKVSHPLLENRENNYLPSFSNIAVSRFDGDHAYLVCDRLLENKGEDTRGHWYGVLATVDSGTSWEWKIKAGGGSSDYTVRDGKEAQNIQDSWVKEAFGGEFIRFIEVGVAPFDGEKALVTDWYRVLQTKNGGDAWNEAYSEKQEEGSCISRGLDVTTAYGVHVDPFDPHHIAISYTDIGYHHSKNEGESWFRSVEGVPVAWDNTCYGMVFDPDVQGKVWSVWSSLHDFPRGKMTRNPEWKNYSRGGVCVSENGGDSWAVSSEGLGENAPATSIVLDPNSEPGNRTLYATVYNKGVFKSTDDGKNWILKNVGIEAAGGFWQVEFQPDGGLLLVTTPTPQHLAGKRGREVYWGAVYYSSNGADSWEKLPLPAKIKFPNHIVTDPTNSNRLLLSCWGDITLSDLVGRGVAESTGENTHFDLDGGLWLSEDRGQHWTNIFDKEAYVYAATIDSYHPDHFYLNTFNHGTWKSTDGGSNWRKLPGYDFHWGHQVIIDPADREKVYLTTFGGSVWHGPG